MVSYAVLTSCIIKETSKYTVRCLNFEVLQFSSIIYKNVDSTLTFHDVAVSLLTARSNIQQFYMVLALRSVFCADLRTERPLLYTSLTDWFL